MTFIVLKLDKIKFVNDEQFSNIFLIITTFSVSKFDIFKEINEEQFKNYNFS